MGENVKCICTGDVKQVDNPHLTSENNGMNWIVKCFKNNKNYGHIVLNGEKSRGPIADMVRERGL
jgi:PhoH-like ATPase